MKLVPLARAASGQFNDLPRGRFLVQFSFSDIRHSSRQLYPIAPFADFELFWPTANCSTFTFEKSTPDQPMKDSQLSVFMKINPWCIETLVLRDIGFDCLETVFCTPLKIVRSRYVLSANPYNFLFRRKHFSF